MEKIITTSAENLTLKEIEAQIAEANERIGALLKEIKERKLYEAGGYKDVYTYASARYGYSRAGCALYIKAAEKDAAGQQGKNKKQTKKKEEKPEPDAQEGGRQMREPDREVTHFLNMFAYDLLSRYYEWWPEEREIGDVEKDTAEILKYIRNTNIDDENREYVLEMHDDAVEIFVDAESVGLFAWRHFERAIRESFRDVMRTEFGTEYPPAVRQQEDKKEAAKEQAPPEKPQTAAGDNERALAAEMLADAQRWLDKVLTDGKIDQNGNTVTKQRITIKALKVLLRQYEIADIVTGE